VVRLCPGRVRGCVAVLKEVIEYNQAETIEKEGEKMEYLSWLAPVAFVFALSALAQVGSLKKEVKELKEELKK